MYAVRLIFDPQKLKEFDIGKEAPEGFINLFNSTNSNFKGIRYRHGLWYGYQANSLSKPKTVVECVVWVQKLAKRYEWFQPSLSFADVLRIEEESDLFPALRSKKNEFLQL